MCLTLSGGIVGDSIDDLFKGIIATGVVRSEFAIDTY